jgi:hypothetical protein
VRCPGTVAETGGACRLERLPGRKGRAAVGPAMTEIPAQIRAISIEGVTVCIQEVWDI